MAAASNCNIFNALAAWPGVAILAVADWRSVTSADGGRSPDDGNSIADWCTFSEKFWGPSPPSLPRNESERKMKARSTFPT